MIRAFATAGLNTIETAIVKSTFEDEERPKLKHLTTIKNFIQLEYAGERQGTYYSNHDQQNKIDLILIFKKRLQQNSWQITLKTLIVLHTLFRDTNQSFIEEFIEMGERNIFAYTRIFSDRSSTDGLKYSTLIRKYSTYINEKLQVNKSLGFNIEKRLGQNTKNFFKTYSAAKLGIILPKMMQQISKAMDVHSDYDYGYVHDIVRAAILLLIKDTLRLYSAIQLCLWELLSSFQKLSLSQAQWLSRSYEKYFEMNKHYSQWFINAVDMGVVKKAYLPKFNTLPETLAVKLRDYIKHKEKSYAKKKKSKNIEHTTADLNEILDDNELLDFSKSVYKYKKEKAMVKVIEPPPKKSRKRLKKKGSGMGDDVVLEGKENICLIENGSMVGETDFLGFDDLLSMPANSSNNMSFMEDGVFGDSEQWLNSLNVESPKDTWANWENLEEKNVENTETNFNDSGQPDIWSSVEPVVDGSNVDDLFSISNMMNSNVNDGFSSFLDVNDVNENVRSSSGKIEKKSVSGSTARVLTKKSNKPNGDAFSDLITWT